MTTIDPETARVAEGLNDKEKSAVCRLSKDYSTTRLFIGVSTSRLFLDPPLAEVGPDYKRRLTPLGLAIREYLERNHD